MRDKLLRCHLVREKGFDSAQPDSHSEQSRRVGITTS